MSDLPPLDPLATTADQPPPGDITHRLPDLDEALAEVHGLDRADVVSFVWSDQRQRWRRGERVCVEDYLERLPELREDADAILDILFRELMLREDVGDFPALEELQQRFPKLGPQLQRQFSLHQALKSSAPAAPTDAEKTVAVTSEQTRNPRSTDKAPPAELPSQKGGSATIPGYDILAELGRGGMGVVYKARHLKLGRVVALKMILSGAHAGPQQLARFQREAEAAARLQHPNIVQVYEVDKHDGRPYFSLELIEGSNLADRIDGSPQPPREAAQLIETLARAVYFAHQHGVVHRDLKPANVLLDAQGQPHITDFGLAKRIDLAEGQTATGDILGTPMYMAPEQATGRNKLIGPATDIYALGTILYEMLTGHPPFEAEDAWHVVMLVTSAEPLPPSRLQRKVPADLETICLKCLEKDPARRYASADALANDLSRFLAGEPINARPVSTSQRLWKWSKRRPALAALLAVSVLATVALFGGWVLYHLRLHDALQQAQDRSEESRQHLVRLHVANGTRLLDDNDWFGSLVWFAEALRLDQGDAARERIHRLRLACVLRQCPQLRQLWAHEGAVHAVHFSPDGRLLLTASGDGTARVWDVENGVAVGQPLTHEGAVLDAEFSGDGRRVVTAGRDGSARVWDARTGAPLTPPLKQQGALVCASFAPDGKRVLTAGEEPVAYLWDAQTGARLSKSFRHGARIHWAVFSPDGHKVLTAGEDGSARLWTTEGGAASAPLKHGGPVRYACFSADGLGVLTCSADGTGRVWQTSTGRPLTSSLKHRRAVVHGAWSPDGKLVVTASEDGSARLWDTSTGEQATPLLRHRSEVNSAVFSADGQFVLTASDDNTSRVWDTASGEPVAPVLNHNGSLDAVAFSPVGTLLATTSRAGAVRLWDLAPQRLLPDASGAAVGPLPAPPRGDSNRPAAAVTSPDGRRVVKFDEERVARIYDVETGQAVSPPLRHTSAIKHASFSPDGRRLVTASDDNTARLWDASTGALLTHPLRHQGTVVYASFDPSGQLVVTACVDKTARVWNADSGEALTPPLPHPCEVRGAWFSADGERVLTLGGDDVPRAWAMPHDERPLAELLRLSQLLSGNHIDPRLGYLPLEGDQLRDLWRK